MKFNLIICTYCRREAIERLLLSVKNQKLYPDEILIIDASPDDLTKMLFDENAYPYLKYFKVGRDYKGLTRQRNFGIKHSKPGMDIICFLDDDIILDPNYFEKLIDSYKKYPDAIGVGGYIKEGVSWKKISENYLPRFEEFQFDGFVRSLGQRNVLRKRLFLLSDKPPGYMPDFSHGFSTGFLPPSDKIYPVEFFMGGVASYKHEIFSKIGFSEKFVGYGLYEDLDFCLKASRIGQLYLNTAAKVDHHHDEGGRPDFYKYGRMVIENGYYVWKMRNPSPSVNASIKFWIIHILLIMIRFVNGFSKDKRAFRDTQGRLRGILKIWSGW